MSLLRHLTVDITPLRISRDYRLLFFGQLISFFGSMMTFVVIPVQMYQLTGSNFHVGMLYAAEFVPMIILSFIGGALADAVDRRMMLRGTEIGQTFVTAILLANAFLPEPQLWVLYVGVALHAGLAGLQRPSYEAMIQQIMPSELMSAVSALNSIRFSIGFIISPAIAGLIIVQFGAKIAYAIDFVTFAASLVAVWMISKTPGVEDPDHPGIASIIKGFRYAIGRQELLGTYIVDINAMFFAMPMALFPALATQFGESSVGLFYSAMGLGPLVASLTSGWTKKINRHGMMVLVAAGLWGVMIIFFGLAESLWVSLGFLALAWFFDMISGIFRATIWNQTIPMRYRGRLAGIEMISYLTGPMLGNAKAGIVASFYGVQFAIVSGGILAVIGAVALAVFLPNFWTYDGREGVKLKEIADSESMGGRK
ncbi:MAG: MFS transporter [Aridibacter famidurans]|nr:MFS transporter [Aridibacter famidurans]